MKQVFSILSPNPILPEDHCLSIRVGEKHFGFSITPNGSPELQQLAWYTGEEITADLLREIYLNHPELKQSFGRLAVCYDYPQSILVPQNIYNPDHTRSLLYTMFGVPGNDVLLTEAIPSWQLQNVYSIPATVHEWIAEHFGAGVTATHTYSVGLKQVETTDFEGSLSLDFRPDDFSMIVTRANKLMMAQTFPYSTPADVIYYLLDTCREFSFNQESVRVAISGLVDQQSVLYRELYNYFLHLKFREPDWIMPPVEQPYPAHFFTSLNDLAQCES